MKQQFENIIDQEVQLELNVAELYSMYCREFPQDFEFWWKLVEEEHNHAALLRSLKQIAPVIGGFPPDFFPKKLEEVTAANKMVLDNIKEFKKHPSRHKAFTIAYEIEQSAGELHYQAFMDKSVVPDDFEIFQKLNHDDKDHAERIKKYMLDNNI